LTPEGGRAPRFTTRLPRDVDAKLRAIARGRGCKPSVVVREAVERHLAELEAAAPPGSAT
jgi:predicted DNA-binding protein